MFHVYSNFLEGKQQSAIGRPWPVSPENHAFVFCVVAYIPTKNGIYTYMCISTYLCSVMLKNRQYHIAISTYLMVLVLISQCFHVHSSFESLSLDTPRSHLQISVVFVGKYPASNQHGFHIISESYRCFGPKHDLSM